MHTHAICVHDHRGMSFLIHITWVTLVSLCMRHASICLMLWRALARPSTSMLAHAIYTSVKPYRCAIVHQTQNSSGFSWWKWGTSVTVFSQRKLVKNSVLYDAPEAKPYRISATKIRRNVAEFSSWKFGNDSKHTRETSIKTTPFPKPNSKPNLFEDSKANANSLIFNC